jgi:hypothetical protein
MHTQQGLAAEVKEQRLAALRYIFESFCQGEPPDEAQIEAQFSRDLKSDGSQTSRNKDAKDDTEVPESGVRDRGRGGNGGRDSGQSFDGNGDKDGDVRGHKDGKSVHVNKQKDDAGKKQTGDAKSGGKRQGGTAQKRFGGMGERALTMDMTELMGFYEYTGMSACIPKTLLTK